MVSRKQTPAEVHSAHNRAVLSELAVAISVPSGLNATPPTGPWWPLRTRTTAPAATSHSRAVRSKLAVATSVPSGLNATPPPGPGGR